MKNKVIDFLCFILIILTIIFMIISSIGITYSKFTLKSYSNYLIIIGVIGLIIYIISKINNFKFNHLEIIIFIMVILSCLSLINAININDALYGKIRRYEGLYVILTYNILMLIGMNIRNKKYLKIIIGFIILYCLINLFYGLYQVGIFNKPNIFDIRDSWYYARGFMGNSMFFSTLMTLFYGISIGLFIKCNILSKKVISYILVFLSSIGIIISGAMSAYVSVGAIWIVVIIKLVYCFIKKEPNRINKLICFFMIVISFIGILLINIKRNNNLKEDLIELGSQTSEISKGNIKYNFGTGRIYIWENTIKKIFDNRGIGVGIDNFYNAFNGKLIDEKSELPVDKAHNDYLQKMLCEGLIAGIIFIIFILYIFFSNFIKRYNEIYYGLFLAFTCYSIQAFFNISVTRVAPIYFIVIGLLIRGNLDYGKD